VNTLDLSTRLIVLDTNVLVHLLRNNSTGQSLEAKFNLSARAERPLLCSVVEGELRGLADWWGWGPARIAKLEQILSQLVRVSAGELEVVKCYGRLYAQQTKLGKKVGENDLWIAATATAIDGVVLTCDSDFLKFDPTLVKCVYFPV
jgi:predicted nucleic acid-binding protein